VLHLHLEVFLVVPQQLELLLQVDYSEELNKNRQLVFLEEPLLRNRQALYSEPNP
jgi:hypothetical protein